MPKVVGHDKTKKKRVTCRGCTAVVEYTESEVKQRSYSVMGDSSGHSFIKCPECKKEITIPGTSW
jgi:RNase P subunit RPR2